MRWRNQALSVGAKFAEMKIPYQSHCIILFYTTSKLGQTIWRPQWSSLRMNDSHGAQRAHAVSWRVYFFIWLLVTQGAIVWTSHTLVACVLLSMCVDEKLPQTTNQPGTLVLWYSPIWKMSDVFNNKYNIIKFKYK